MNNTLPPALTGQRVRFGGLHCYVAGRGAPLLLVHSVNAAASAAEVRPLYEHYSAQRTVFALDLPGFGGSERSDRDYTPRLMTDALHSAAKFIRRECGPRAIDALALSLGCEFLARAACEAPAQFGRLAFVSPTGLDGHTARRGPLGSTREVPGLHALLRQPWWAEWLYRRLTRPKSIRHFLEGSFGRKQIDETMWAYAVAVARQPGARHAPLHFLAGKLFSADIHRIYDALAQPVWMSHGERGDFTDFRAVDIVPGTARWQRTIFPTGALPHMEQPREFCRIFDGFLRDDPLRRVQAQAAVAASQIEAATSLP
jgi:pimeloyl-ACP methyl ester carboxylesterase